MKTHIGKLAAFIGIVVVSINQYFDLIGNIVLNKKSLFGIALIVLAMGFLADEIIGGKK